MHGHRVHQKLSVAVMAVHTEVLPYVAIRIPCLPPSIASAPNSASYATRPTCLPLAVTLLLLMFFAGFTSLALGTDGMNHLTRRATGYELVPDPWHKPPVSLPLDERTQQAASQAADREAKRLQRSETDDETWISRLRLISVPPLNAEPFSILVSHEYSSLFVFLVRAFLLRTLWHLLLWWHVACAAACGLEIAWWRWSHRRSDSSSTGVLVPSISLLVVHASYWIGYSLIFGWPSVYLLRRRLHTKAKAS